MENTQQAGSGGGNGAVIAVLVLIVVVLAAWFAYKQGYLTGKDQQPEGTKIEINLPGGSPAAN